MAKLYVKRDTGGDSRITIVHGDFTDQNLILPEQIDLITCMLGTISHFCWTYEKERNYSVLLETLRRIRKIIADDGVFIVSSWSEEAKRKKKFLSIYNPKDSTKLSNWSPSIQELSNLLEQAKFDFKYHPVHDRLVIWTCTPC